MEEDTPFTFLLKIRYKSLHFLEIITKNTIQNASDEEQKDLVVWYTLYQGINSYYDKNYDKADRYLNYFSSDISSYTPHYKEFIKRISLKTPKNLSSRSKIARQIEENCLFLSCDLISQIPVVKTPNQSTNPLDLDTIKFVLELIAVSWGVKELNIKTVLSRLQQEKNNISCLFY
ncbi:hypothetical protein [uncultured Shewanella sp.]|uniref:hypothetical protein n=1 Tax=uncultured Shewanella sp. TaxID=173975 RepID=UPI00262672AF|nr:hypothetical protein [uncultured Shewanella sp.]